MKWLRKSKIKFQCNCVMFGLLLINKVNKISANTVLWNYSCKTMTRNKVVKILIHSFSAVYTSINMHSTFDTGRWDVLLKDKKQYTQNVKIFMLKERHCMTWNSKNWRQINFSYSIKWNAFTKLWQNKLKAKN